MDKRTPLYEEHQALGARTTPFAGWEMPVSYPAGPVEEHRRVRQVAGLFDLSHMGQVLVSGDGALSLLQHVLTANVARLAPGGAVYAPMCYADGGLVDDTFLYRIPEGYYLVVNASNTDKDVAWLEYQAGGQSGDVRIENRSAATGMLAIQGPRAEAILQPLAAGALAGMPRNTAQCMQVAGVPSLVGRTGYTGEDGFELYIDAGSALDAWRAILAAGEPEGLLPVGLAARDSLRFEASFPLYGHELDAAHTPLQAGLSWAVALRKGPFCGRDALLKERLEGSTERLVGFEMIDRGVPRHAMPVLIDGAVRGHVTSGLYAPTLDRFLGMAYLPPGHATIGTEIGIDIRGQVRRARVVKRPFYTPAYQRKQKGS